MSFPWIGSLVLLLLIPNLRGEDWPQWRGPRRDGTWKETSPLCASGMSGTVWRAGVGAGYSSPVIAGGCVYLTDAELIRPTCRERIHCFEQETGRLLWSKGFEVAYPDWVFTPGQAGGPTATPVVHRGNIYTLGATGMVRRHQAKTGRVTWERDLQRDLKVREFSCRSSPLVEENLLILHIGGKPGASVVAFDLRTGREVWRALDDAVSNSSPIVISAGGQRQLIVWTLDSVTSLNPATGAVYWRELMKTSGNDGIATPVVSGQSLAISGLMLRLDALHPAASILWPENRAASKRILSNTSTPLFYRGALYACGGNDGTLVCLDPADGRRLWSTNGVATPGSGASIHFTDVGKTVLLYNDQGELIRAELSRSGYRELERVKMVEPIYPFGGRKLTWSPATFANGFAFARTDVELVCARLPGAPPERPRRTISGR